MADQGSKRPNPFATDAKDSKRHHPDGGNIPPKNFTQFQGADVPPPSLSSSPAPTQTNSPSIPNFGNATFRSFGSFGSVKLGLFGNAEIGSDDKGLAKPSSQPAAGATTLASNGNGGDKDNKNQQGVQDSPNSTHGGEVVFGKPSVLKPDQSVVRVRAELEQQKMDLTALGSRTNTLETKNDRMELTIHDIQKKIETNNASLRNEILQQVREEMHREISALRPGTPAQVKAKDQDLFFLHEVKGSKTVEVKQEGGGDVVFPKENTDRRNLFAFLNSLDLGSPSGIQAWVAAKGDDDFATMDHVLFARDDGAAYIVRLRGKKPVVLSRRARMYDGVGLPPQNSQLMNYHNHVVQVEYQFLAPVAPKHAIIIGEIWLRGAVLNRMPPIYLSTNYHLLTSVTEKHKALWIMYAYEYPGKHGRTKMYEFDKSEVFQGVELFDIACLAPSLDDIVQINGEPDKGQESGFQLTSDQARENLNSSGRIARPVFTQPYLGDLILSIPRN